MKNKAENRVPFNLICFYLYFLLSETSQLTSKPFLMISKGIFLFSFCFRLINEMFALCWPTRARGCM